MRYPKYTIFLLLLFLTVSHSETNADTPFFFSTPKTNSTKVAKSFKRDLFGKAAFIRLRMAAKADRPKPSSMGNMWEFKMYAKTKKHGDKRFGLMDVSRKWGNQPNFTAQLNDPLQMNYTTIRVKGEYQLFLEVARPKKSPVPPTPPSPVNRGKFIVWAWVELLDEDGILLQKSALFKRKHNVPGTFDLGTLRFE